jgi:uncharacterized RDD family membrane protein YckC
MQKISIETTQNVKIDYISAGIGDRILAYIIDALVILAYFGILAFVFNLFSTNSMVITIALIIPPFLYHLLCEIFMNGQSIGKRQMKIKVVKLDGSSPGIGAYLLRWILRPIDITLFSGGIAILTIAITRHNQRLGDLAADTTVVKMDAQQELPVFAVEENYTPRFPEVVNLSDADIEVIQRVLKVYRDSGNQQPVLVTVEKMKDVLQIDSELPPLQFLYTLVKDYKYLTAL